MAVPFFPDFGTRGMGVALLLWCLLATGAASGNDLTLIADAPAPKPSPTRKASPKTQASKLRWADLTPRQQQTLAPLADEWEKMDVLRKRKWLAISDKYASMKPEEQQRIQQRMREWASLTPEQRRAARESYTRARKLAPEQKSTQWENYQQLPAEQKKKLAAGAASRNPVAKLPSPKQQENIQTLPPIISVTRPAPQAPATPAMPSPEAAPAYTPNSSQPDNTEQTDSSIER